MLIDFVPSHLMMDHRDHVPTVTNIEDVYGAGNEHAKKRFEEIRKRFAECFQSAPECYARSPGRVNLIGEHIDYEGYGVFPMAIAQDTVVAVRRYGTELQIVNLNKEKYPAHNYSIDPEQEVDVASKAWTNYFLAAYKGVYEFLDSKGIARPTPSGLQVLVDGRVPTGSGLSSSSALVCSSALAILAVNQLLERVTKSEIAEFTCTCERHSGTESGGMDQAISIMAEPGFAKLIEFNPVRGTDVSLPLSGTFVVANSLAVSNKAETANERYNLRVVECRIAAMLLGQALGLPFDRIQDITMLKQIEDLDDLAERAASSWGFLNCDVPASLCRELVRKVLKDADYTVQEVEDTLKCSLKKSFADSPNSLRVLEWLSETRRGLQLHKRARHVFEESARVIYIKEICEDADLTEEEKLKRIGEHMNVGHGSSRDLYNCSCPELEELISICNANGALGSRLTGAGWGGCAVSLIPESHTAVFIQSIKDSFYAKRIQSGQITADALDVCIFASKPSGGGAVLKL